MDLLFSTDGGMFPLANWSSFGDALGAADAGATAATAADLGLLNADNLPPELQDVLTPDALASLGASLGGLADSAAGDWATAADEQIPLTDADLAALAADPPPEEPNLNPAYIDQWHQNFGGIVDSFLADMALPPDDEIPLE
jgi:hypothetical protein